MKSLTLVLWLFVFLPCFSEGRKHTTGNDLAKNCKFLFAELNGSKPTTLSASEEIDTGYCEGFLEGVIDEEQSLAQSLRWVETESTSGHFCLPENSTQEQLLRLLKKWMDKHPEQLHKSGEFVIHEALAEVFPCK